MERRTADVCDVNPDARVLALPLRDFGGRRVFDGPVSTLRVLEDNLLVRRALQEPGQGRVLVVDGGGSLRTALLGDQLASLAVQNGWAGLVLNGAVRDSAVLATLAGLGVKALGTCPRKSAKEGKGERDVPVSFGGVIFTPGEHVYADEDGVVVLPAPLGG